MITVLLFNNSTSQLKTIDLQAVLHCPDSHLYLINNTYPGIMFIEILENVSTFRPHGSDET